MTQYDQLELKILLQNKKFKEVQQLLMNLERSDKIIKEIISIHEQLSYQNQDEYENILYIICLFITPKTDIKIYYTVVSSIIKQIIALTSVKYSLVTLRSFLYKLKSQQFSKLVVLSHLHMYTSLLYDPTIQDFQILYLEYKQLTCQILKNSSDIQQKKIKQLHKIIINSHYKILSNFISSDYQINQNRTNKVLSFLAIVINFIDELKTQQFNNNSQKICLDFLSKFQVVVDRIQSLPLLFANAVYKNYLIKLESSLSSIMSQELINKIILKSMCLQLPHSLNQPAKISVLKIEIIFNFIKRLTSFLHNRSHNLDYFFLIQNYKQIQQLIQKVNIFMGYIDPIQELYKYIQKQFIPLRFLSQQLRQNILSNTIQKHNNQNFKINILVQYRKLLTFKSSKKLWIRSSSTFIQQLCSIQPNMSINFISHLLSFAYYWKAVTIHFLSQPKFKQKLYFNIDEYFYKFNQKILKIKKGLQDRNKMLNQQKKQQRSEISVCLFRIDELMNPNQIFQTKIK